MKRKLVCKVNGWETRCVFPTKVYREHANQHTRLVCIIEVHKNKLDAMTMWRYDPYNELYK
jgi:hypothetical protein